MKMNFRVARSEPAPDGVTEFKLNFGSLYRWPAPDHRECFDQNNRSFSAQPRTELGFRLARDREG